MQTFSTASDSESDHAHKQKFFQQLESQWRESHTGEPIDYALLNRLTSSSFDPESSSSPERSPSQRGRFQGDTLDCMPALRSFTQTEAIWLSAIARLVHLSINMHTEDSTLAAMHRQLGKADANVLCLRLVLCRRQC